MSRAGQFGFQGQILAFQFGPQFLLKVPDQGIDRQSLIGPGRLAHRRSGQAALQDWRVSNRVRDGHAGLPQQFDHAARRHRADAGNGLAAAGPARARSVRPGHLAARLAQVFNKFLGCLGVGMSGIEKHCRDNARFVPQRFLDPIGDVV